MKITITFIFTLLFLSVHSQNKITGVVKDEKSETIPSASIILKDNSEKIIAYTYSDAFGKYSLSTDKIGEFILSANSMGFEQKKLTSSSITTKIKFLILH